jgi:hypothetical protein
MDRLSLEGQMKVVGEDYRRKREEDMRKIYKDFPLNF